MSREQVINEVANDRVWFVSQFRDDAADERAAASMPFEIDGAVKVARAVNLRPTMRPACLDQTLINPNFRSSCGSLMILLRRDPRPVVMT